MPHDVASDQGLHCLLIGFSIQNRIKVTKNSPDTPKMTTGLVQHITMEESTSMQRVELQKVQSLTVFSEYLDNYDITCLKFAW